MTVTDSFHLVTLQLRYEHDVVLARQRARQIAELLRLDPQDQVRMATAVSELARNAFQYASGGRVEFEVARSATGRQALVVRVTDTGPGIADLTGVLSGTYESPTGMGVGLVGARRMADAFDIASSPAGTRVELVKHLPLGYEVTARDTVRVADALMKSSAGSAFEEVQQQNQELLQALGELRARQAEVERLNAELEETNRGVLALYAELDDRAEDLRRASEVKSRFLSDVGHELRTPLTSMINLSRILLDRADGPLTQEQEHQVRLIHRSAGSLTEMVNDLLDLAKIEAGKTTLRRVDATAAELLAALRGMFRPLVEEDAPVALVIEEPAEPIALHTDDGRLSQILRNFVSNALKFTERGEVRVRATAEPGDLLRVDVVDTGIGIAPEDQARIFEEFTQVDSSVQRRVRGTGLGLPLARKLAHMLGGRVELVSAPGAGSTFTLVVPRTLPDRGSDSDVLTQPAAAATMTGGSHG